jgi:hypothetical protein
MAALPLCAPACDSVQDPCRRAGPPYQIRSARRPVPLCGEARLRPARYRRSRIRRSLRAMRRASSKKSTSDDCAAPNVRRVRRAASPDTPHRFHNFADASPLPQTSPIDTTTRPPLRVKTSYKSPPMRLSVPRSIQSTEAKAVDLRDRRRQRGVLQCRRDQFFAAVRRARLSAVAAR